MVDPKVDEKMVSDIREVLKNTDSPVVVDLYRGMDQTTIDAINAKPIYPIKA